MTIECECKIPVPSREAVSERLRALGAVFRGGGREDNRVFDTPSDDLLARGVLLRVRVVEGAPGGLLTVKAAVRAGAFKTREEYETRVDDPGALAVAFAALGYVQKRRYQKHRDEWDWRGTHIAVDTLPEMGDFVEVEGSEDAIHGVLAELGFDPAAHRQENYLALWDAYRATRGEPPCDMLFDGG